MFLKKLLGRAKAVFSLLKKSKTVERSSEISDPRAKIILRKFEMLSSEEQNVVKTRVCKLREADYEMVLKYGEEVSEKTTVLINVTMDAFSETQEFYYDKKISGRQLVRTVVDSKICLGGLKAFMNALMAVRTETELRILAIDMMLEEVRKKRYEFLGAIGAEGALKKLRMRQVLENVDAELRTIAWLIEAQIMNVANSIRTDENLFKATILSLAMEKRTVEYGYFCDYLRDKVTEIIKKYNVVFKSEFRYGWIHIQEEGVCRADRRDIDDALYILSSSDDTEKRVLAEQRIIVQLATWQYQLDLYGFLHMKDYQILFPKVEELKNYHYNCSDVSLSRESFWSEKRSISANAPAREMVEPIYRELERFEVGCKKYIDPEIQKGIDYRKVILNVICHFWTGKPFEGYHLDQSGPVDCLEVYQEFIEKIFRRIATEYGVGSEMVADINPRRYIDSEGCRLALICLACVCKTACAKDDEKRGEDCKTRNGTCAKRILMITKICEAIYNYQLDHPGNFAHEVLTRLEVEAK